MNARLRFEEAQVVIARPDARREWMLVIPDLAPDETAADHTLGGFIEAEWNKLFKQAEGAP